MKCIYVSCADGDKFQLRTAICLVRKSIDKWELSVQIEPSENDKNMLKYYRNELDKLLSLKSYAEKSNTLLVDGGFESVPRYMQYYCFNRIACVRRISN